MAFSKFYDSTCQRNLQLKSPESSKDIIKRIISNELEWINFCSDEKSDEISIQLREVGNKKFKHDIQFDDLIVTSSIYTNSLFHAKSKIEKAYSCGNRSSVLFKMGLYNQCLTDINMSLEKYEYPITKIYKLLIRKAESFLNLNDFPNASSNFSKALLNLENYDPQNSSWKTRILNGLKQCQLNESDKILSKTINISTNYTCFNNKLDNNPQIPSMSNKLQLKVNKEDGRGIFATSDISIGDILSVEHPYAYRLSSECFLTHCYFCLSHNVNLMACIDCNKVGFCNDECQSNATIQLRHDLECGLITEILSTKSKELGLLAYGTVVQTPVDRICYVVDLMEKDCEKNEMIMNLVDSQSYLSAITIETNENLRTYKDIFDRCVSSVFLAQCYKKLLRNNHNSNEILSTICYAFCQHLQGLPCNAHSISEMTIPPSGSLESSSVNYIGNALYPALSMINHSCSPNIIRLTFGKGQCVLKAIAPIRTGDQIFDNYSYHFATMRLKERNLKLKEQYYFNCRCRACIENWPTFENHLHFSDEDKIICTECRQYINLSTLTCSNCNISFENDYQRFVVLKSLLSIKMELLLKRQLLDVEKYLLEFSFLLYSMIEPPNILFNQTSEMLKLIWSMNGSTVSYF